MALLTTMVATTTLATTTLAVAYTSWILAAGTALFALVAGIILAYHWYRFALSPVAATIASALYAAGCLIFLSMLFNAVHLLVL